MANEMVERAARAACKADGFDPDDLLCEGSTDQLWTSWVPCARAAIEAMREPTYDMSHAGTIAAVKDQKGMPSVYAAMIDAALTDREG